MRTRFRSVSAFATLCAAQGLVTPCVSQESNQPRLQTQSSHSQIVTTTAWSPDKKLLATGSADGTVAVWDAKSGYQIFKSTEPWGPVYQVALCSAADVPYLFSVSGERVLNFNLVTQEFHSWSGRAVFSSLAVTSDCQRVFVGNSHGAAFDVTVSEDKGGQIAGLTGIRRLWWDEAARVLVGADSDGTAKLWHPDANKLISVRTPMSDPLAVGFDRGSMRAWLMSGNGIAFVDSEQRVETVRLKRSIDNAAEVSGQFPVWATSSGALVAIDASGNVKEQRSLQKGPGEELVPTAVASSSEGIVVGFDTGHTRLWRHTMPEPITLGSNSASREVDILSGSDDGQGLFVIDRSGASVRWALLGEHAGTGAPIGAAGTAIAVSRNHRWALLNQRGALVGYDVSRNREFPVEGNGSQSVFCGGRENPIIGNEIDDSGVVAIACRDGSLSIFRRSDDRFVRHPRYVPPENGIANLEAMTIAPGGNRIVLAGRLRGEDGSNRVLHFLDLPSFARETVAIPAGEYGTGFVRSIAVSQDGTRVLAVLDDLLGADIPGNRYWGFLFNQQTKATQRLEGDVRVVTSASFLGPDQSLILTGTEDGRTHIWDPAHPEKAIHVLPGAGGMTQVTGLGSTDNFAISQGGQVALWSLNPAKETLRIIRPTRAPGLFVRADGRFDTEDYESEREIAWLVADDPIRPLPMDIFSRDYYEPRLWSRMLAGEELQPVRSLASLNRVQPAVEISAVEWEDEARGMAKVTVRVGRASDLLYRGEQRVSVGTDVYDVRLFRDGQLVGWAPTQSEAWQKRDRSQGANSDRSDLQRWRKLTKVPLRKDGTQELSFPVRVPGRSDLTQIEFSAYGFNEDRVKSATARRVLAIPKQSEAGFPRAYIISVGVNRTQSSPNWDLMYAADDARILSSVLEEALRKTDQFTDVIPLRLISDAAHRAQGKEAPATKTQVKAVLDALAGRQVDRNRHNREIPNFERVRKAEPEDLIVLSFSSHGFTDSEGVFHLMLHDIGRGHPEDRISDRLRAASLSSDDLSQWLRAVDAGEIALIVDACHSEATVAQKGFKPGPMGSRGLGQLAYDKGMRILAASQTSQSAIEIGQDVRQGVLSHVLVNLGLRLGLADLPNKDDRILLSEWFAYAVGEVPKLITSAGVDASRLAARRRDVRYLGPDAPALLQQPVLFDFGRKRRDVVISVLEPFGAPQ